MSCYVVIFDANGNAADATIRERLKTLNAYCPITNWSWAVLSDSTAAQLRDFLSQELPGSRIFVIRSGTEAAWINAFGTANSDWLKKNL